MTTALVIPSNRPDRLHAFFHAWHESGQADWDVAIVVQDTDQPFACHGGAECYHRTEIRRRLWDDAWIISRGDSACRCFGFLIAAELGADHVLTLDDDCLPIAGAAPICAAHRQAMRFAAWQPTAGMRTRGMPYRNSGAIEARLNVGLWQGVADVDGPSGLTPQPYFYPPAGTRLANPLHRYPLCGMNLFFSIDLLPTLYFPPMGEGQPYRRFDDIWAGLIFQRVARHLQIPWSIGEPHIEHVRASDPFRNLIAEAPGIAVNETLWQRLDSIELTARELPGTVREIAADLSADRDDYLRNLGRALERWVDLTRGSP